MRRGEEADRFEISGVAERLAAYGVAPVRKVSRPETPDSELVEKAATLLLVMPRRPRRESFEALLSPRDPERGRRVVDALIDSAFVAEDERGRLRRLA